VSELGYCPGMHRWLILGIALAACSSKPNPVPPKRPNAELIVGDYERHKPGETAMKFDIDGKYRVTKNKAELEHTPYLSEGTYKLDKDELTLEADKGACSEQPEEKAGTYKVVVSKIGIRFVKMQDSCEQRGHLDGQTMWRIK
jgi:hypothetical protein